MLEPPLSSADVVYITYIRLHRADHLCKKQGELIPRHYQHAAPVLSLLPMLSSARLADPRSSVNTVQYAWVHVFVWIPLLNNVGLACLAPF